MFHSKIRDNLQIDRSAFFTTISCSTASPTSESWVSEDFLSHPDISCSIVQLWGAALRHNVASSEVKPVFNTTEMCAPWSLWVHSVQDTASNSTRWYTSCFSWQSKDEALMLLHLEILHPNSYHHVMNSLYLSISHDANRPLSLPILSTQHGWWSPLIVVGNEVA